MALSEKQLEALKVAAKRAGVSEGSLIASATKISESPPGGPTEELGTLFAYHLPFVTVREVRELFLKLKTRIPGDDQIASTFAASQLKTGN